MGRYRHKTACRPNWIIILYCLLGLALLPCELCQATSESTGRDAATQDDVRVAVGFHFGQSYGTSVAHFPNGTIINLTKVPASDEYMAYMERMIQEPTPSTRPGPFQNLRGLLMWILRIGPSRRDTTVLVRMAAALKAESEAALGRAIRSAAVTAPWMAAWDGQFPSNSIINEVLVLVGIEPLSWEGTHPMYLGETNTLLAANERHVCPDRWCLYDRAAVDQWSIAFLISFTNQSLHTSFQFAHCFYYDSWDNHLATIDPAYGLNKLNESGNPQDFWDSIRKHLLEQVAEHVQRHPTISYFPFLVLVAGEAATEPDFVKALQQVIKAIPTIRVIRGNVARYDPFCRDCFDRQPEVELIVSDNPTFAAARGAAFWMSTWIHGSYCNEWFAAQPGEWISQYNLHDEL